LYRPFIEDFSVATSQYVMYNTAAPVQAYRVWTAVGWSDGALLRTGGDNPSFGNCIAVSVSNGSIGKTYRNGIYVSDLSGTSTVAAPNGDLGLLFPGALKWPTIAQAIVLIKRVLTATEHARIYAQLENMTWNTKGLTPGPMMP
jgi:hypothetical protein